MGIVSCLTQLLQLRLDGASEKEPLQSGKPSCLHCELVDPIQDTRDGRKEVRLQDGHVLEQSQRIPRKEPRCTSQRGDVQNIDSLLQGFNEDTGRILRETHLPRRYEPRANKIFLFLCPQRKFRGYWKQPQLPDSHVLVWHLKCLVS